MYALFCTITQGADGAFDSVGGETTKQLTSSLKEGGKVLIYGAMSGTVGQVDILALLAKDITVKVRTLLHCAAQLKRHYPWLRRQAKCML